MNDQIYHFELIIELYTHWDGADHFVLNLCRQFFPSGCNHGALGTNNSPYIMREQTVNVRI